MDISTVKIGDLRPDPANARTHDERNLDAIAKSLARFGQQKPVVATKDGVIVAGNGTWEAAKRLGWKEIRVVYTGLGGIDLVAYGIADNQTATLAGWDEQQLLDHLLKITEDPTIDALVTGFTADDIADLERRLAGGENTVEEDEAPEPPENPVTRPGDLWVLGEHRLLCGDSKDPASVAAVMGGDRADCVFTSPPYGVGVDYDTYKDTFESLKSSLPVMAELWKSVVCAGGFAVVNFGDIVSAKSIVKSKEPCEYPMALEYWPAFVGAGWLLWSRRVWCKPAAGIGSMQCIGSNRASTNWEHVWTWKRPGKPIVNNQISGEYASQNGWFDTCHDHKLAIGLKDHGAGMPVAVAVRCIHQHSRPRGLVFEPFCGTGTTLIAAEQTGRRCRGVEISPAYCDVIVRRWEGFTGKKAQRVASDAAAGSLPVAVPGAA